MATTPQSTRLQEPLGRSERDRLDLLIRQGNGRVGNFEALDGLFAALLSGSELLGVSQFLPEIMGPAPFGSEGEAQAVVVLLRRHWNAVGRALAEQDPFIPQLAKGDIGSLPGQDWALGYQVGVRLEPSGWNVIRQHRGHGECLRAILALTGELMEEPRLEMKMIQRRPDGTPLIRDHQVATLGANVTRMYRLLAPARRAERGDPALDLKDLERLHEGIEKALEKLPAGGDQVAAIRAVGDRLGLLVPDQFISSLLTARAGGDVRFEEG